jgi:TolB-like protein/Tfp pilus assembly protein PilF
VSSLTGKPLNPIPPEAIRAALDRIASSPGFENSERMVRFLRFAVEKTLAGEAEQLKEYVLGVEVFDRAQTFDPKVDTIVRVEARRLRRKLKEYYESAGAQDRVRIQMPTPGYAPVFVAASAESAPPRWKFRLVWVASGLAVAGLGIGWWASRPKAVTIDSIAVLPFANLSPDKNQEYFCDGFTEELISTLSGIDGLRVVARTSTFAFKDKAEDIREIGRKLNAAAVLEGSVRRSGDTLRITAQLIRTADGYHVWSRSYDRGTKDVLAVQEEISRLIADTVRHPLDRTRGGSVPKMEAYDLYLLGRYHWTKEVPEEFDKAVDYFEKSIAADPKFALANSGLSEVYSYMIDLDYAPTAEILPRARAAADRALALDDSMAEAHTARGLVAHELEWDQVRAGKEFLRTIELKPGYAFGVHWYGHFLEYQGRAEEGRAELNRAMASDPLNGMYLVDLAMNSYKLRRFDAALADVDRLKKLLPDYPFAEVVAGMVATAQGDWTRALAAYQKTREQLGPVPFVLGLIGQTEALAGNRAAAQSNLAELEKMSHSGYVPAFCFAMINYALGDREKGFSNIRKAFEDRNAVLVWLKHTPMFDGAAADPRAKELLDRAGN